jgi:alkaline phosphatase
VNGLDWSILNRARAQAAVQGKSLALDSFPNVTLMQVQGVNAALPDDGSATTALACGRRTKNGFVGRDAQGAPFESILYAAQKARRSTGLVTTGSLTEPSSVAFYGAGLDQDNEAKFASDLVDGSRIDVILGGGGGAFNPAHVLNERGRSDGREILRDAQKLGYYVVRNTDELGTAPKWLTGQLFGVFAPDILYYTGLRQLGTPQPTLAEMTRRSIEFLQYNLTGYLGGYFLVVNHSLLTHAARHNLTALAVNETLALDEAVRTTMDYAGSEAMIVVVSGYSLGALETGSSEETASWLTGPGGPRPPAPVTQPEGHVRRGQKPPAPLMESAPVNPLLVPDRALRYTDEAMVTAGPGLVLSRGRNAEKFGGIIQNTDIYFTLKHEL